MRSNLFALLLVVLLLAGCADGGGPSAAGTSSAPATAAPATVTDVTGGIEGTVTNDEQAPIAGVEVGLVKTNNVTKTAQDGRYSFSGLEPGEYAVTVGSLGYTTSAKKVTVVAGEVAKADFVLQVVALDEGPIIETIPRRGFINCSINPYYSANLCGNAMQDQAHFPFTVREDIKAKELVVELVFQPSQGAFGQRMELNVCDRIDNQTNQVNCATSDYYLWKSGKSPIQIRSEEVPKAKQDYQVTVGAGQLSSGSPEVPLVFQQSFDVYITACYQQECPDEFTAAPPPA